MAKKKIVQFMAITLLLFFTTKSFAQFGNLGQVLATGQGDAEKIFNAYLSPYSNGMGAALSTGWYNTAKAHKLGGFDVTLSFNLAMIPSSDQTYDANELGLGKFPGMSVLIDGASSPTAAGKKDPGQQLTYYQNIPFIGDIPIAKFNLPRGTGFAYAPMPMIQLGIGMVKETELNFRYSPNITWGNGSKVGIWGVGLKHSLKQWIPAINKLPLFDLTLQGGYTKLTSTTGLNFQPTAYEDMGINVSSINNVPGFYDNQELLLDVSNFTANIIVSGDFKVICLYGGVGISSTKSNLQLTGNYPFPSVNNTGQITITDSNALTDPIDLSIKSSDGSALKPRFNAGFRLKFAVVTINFDYTYANYSIASAGLGISFR